LDAQAAAGGVLPYTLAFSAQTSALDTQLQIEEKLDRKRATRCVPACAMCGLF
jgi:hypothetical protein